MRTNKKQKGFALIEVMLAALVMAVGGVAYMKLQQTGLQFSYNNYARTQGLAISQSFVEQLRSNVGVVRAQDNNGSITAGTTIPKVVDCNSSIPGENDTATINTDCSKNVFNYQQALIRQQMAAVSQNSILCYRQGNNGYIRVTYIWRDNSREGKTVQLNCPNAFDTETNQSNAVTIYAQL